MFQGASSLSLDAKGRLSVPTRHRDVLSATAQGQLTITKHPHGCLMVFPRTEWEKFRERIAQLPMSAQWWKRIFLGNAMDVEMDGTGRVLVSPELQTASVRLFAPSAGDSNPSVLLALALLLALVGMTLWRGRGHVARFRRAVQAALLAREVFLRQLIASLLVLASYVGVYLCCMRMIGVDTPLATAAPLVPWVSEVMSASMERELIEQVGLAYWSRMGMTSTSSPARLKIMELDGLSTAIGQCMPASGHAETAPGQSILTRQQTHLLWVCSLTVGSLLDAIGDMFPLVRGILRSTQDAIDVARS